MLAILHEIRIFLCHPVICGGLGALAIKLLDLIEHANMRPANRPDFKSWPYWISFLVTPVLGLLVVFLYVYSGMELKPIIAANIGISAPIILRSWAEKSNDETVSVPAGA